MTLDPAKIEQAARKLLDHRDRDLENPLPQTGERLSNMAVGYAIQRACERILTSEKGYEPIGYKIAATNAVSREHLKIDAPFFGRLYRSMTTKSPAELPSRKDFFRVYEPEIALWIDRDLDAALAPFDETDIEAATGAVLPAVEVIGTHFTPRTDAGAVNLTADNAAHGHWIIGEPIRDWSGLDLMDTPISLIIDGDVKAQGKGRNVDGGPFGAAAWLANSLAAAGRGFKAGEYVTTESTNLPFPIGAGQSVTANFGQLGTVRLRTRSELVRRRRSR